MIKRTKQRAFFSALRNTKLLCFECQDSQLKQVIKYIGEGRVLLECNHERHTRLNQLEEIEKKLDGGKL